MNRQRFQDIARGVYGRKIAYTDVEKITPQNVLNVVANCIGVFNYNRIRIRYLWNYKNGDQPALYRTKTIRNDINNPVVENHAWEIVRFKNGQTYGEPVQLVSLSKEEKVNKAVEQLNTYLKKAHKQVADVTSGEWTSAVGTGFKAVNMKYGKDIPFSLTVPTPMNTFIIYQRQTEEPLLSVQELKDEKGERFYLCFSDTHEYRIKNGSLLNMQDHNGMNVVAKLHTFGAVPIVEYPNNASRISDIELVITMLDAINEIASNRVDSISQFVQSWVKFVNCEIDEENFQKMKMAGALVVKSNNGSENKADVDIMTQELDQTQTQVAKKDMLDNILTIEAIPNTEYGSDGGSTQGAVALRSGWDFSKQATQLKDTYIVQGEERLVEVVLNVLHVTKGKSECPLTSMDYEVVINHSPLDNLQVKVQCLQMLMQSGIHPLVAIKVSGIWSDAEKVFMLSKPYLDNIYKTIDDAIKEQNLQTQVAQAQALVDKGNGNANAENGQAKQPTKQTENKVDSDK